MTENKVSPVRKQYLEIKKEHPNEIVFFRLGDFYETFDHDAEIASRELDIVLTSRNVAKNQRVPMAGVPFHAADNYIARLLKKGFHVAICEQMGDQPDNGLFDRQVVRVLSPGTIINPNILNNSSNNYLAVIYPSNTEFGFAYIDLSTGEFNVTSFAREKSENKLLSEVSRIQPSEIIIPESYQFEGIKKIPVTKIADWHFEIGRCQQLLKLIFNVETLDGFGLENKPLQSISSGVAVDYINQHDASALALLSHIHSYSIEDFMVLDESTRRSLEITGTLSNSTAGTLLQVIDKTKTPMGKRLIKNWINQPLIHKDAINNRLDVVEFFYEKGIDRLEIQEILKKFSDIERIINRIFILHATPRDLISIKNSIMLLPVLSKHLEETKEQLSKLNIVLNLLEEEAEFIRNAIVDNPPATLKKIGLFRRGFSEELDAIILATKESRNWISNLERNEKEKTGIKSLKVGFNKVYGYYIEISKSQASQAPDHYIRKQTLVNAERFITAELKDYETLVLNAEERIREVEAKLFDQVCKKIGSSLSKILETSKAISTIDVLISFSQLAVENQYSRPEVSENKEIKIKNGRHPVVENSKGLPSFVPNDTNLFEEEFIHIITGPNMSGKSTYLRQVALIVLLTQIGSFVPAETAKIGLVDRIFTRIGAQDEIHAGLSTFMVEMIETANILNSATSRSLLVLDEIGRGTSTYDGLSIAWSILEYIHNHPRLKPLTLFATHYHELTNLPETLPNIKNYNVAVSEDGKEIVFLYKILEGKTNRSYGIHVAQMAGVPKVVTNRASVLLEQLENLRSGHKINISNHSEQLPLFKPNPIIEEISSLDLNSISPIDALNKIFEWQNKAREK